MGLTLLVLAILQCLMCPVILESMAKMIHIEHWVQAKEWGNAELKCIVAHSLSNGVRNISEWSEFTIGSSKVFLLQMQTDFVAHPKLVWYPMLIMLLLVLGI